jgi:chemotaxis protein MotB
MTRLPKALVLLGTLAVMVSAGCAEKKKDAGGDKVADDAALLKQAQLDLQRAQAEAKAAQDRLAELEAQNGQLKAQLSGATKEPAAAPGWKTVPGGAMISLDGTVLFDSGKNTLKPSGEKTLNDVAATLKSKYPDYDIYVFGHTDTQPIKHSKWKDNYELSCERSLSVVRYLMGKGIKPQSLAACGWGQYRPVAPNSTAAERAYNRRVEIFAMAPHGNKIPQDTGKPKNSP